MRLGVVATDVYGGTTVTLTEFTLVRLRSVRAVATWPQDQKTNAFVPMLLTLLKQYTF